jgi:hypothetical protein
MPFPEHKRNTKGFDKRPENINKKGRPPVLPDLKRAIAQCLAEEKDGKVAFDQILAALRLKAVKGDVRAAQELMDRAYGKANQKIEHTGIEPITIKVINGNKD